MTRSRTGNVNPRDLAVARIRTLWPEIPAADVPAIEREIDGLLGARVHRQTFCSIPPVRNIRSSLERALSLKCAGSKQWRGQLPPRETVLAGLCVAKDGQLGSSIGQLLRAVGADYLTVPRCRAASPLREGSELGSPKGSRGVMTPDSTPRNSDPVELPASQAPPVGVHPPAPTSMNPTSIQHIRVSAATVRAHVNRAVPLPGIPEDAPRDEQLEIVVGYLADRAEASEDAAVAMHNILVDAVDDALRSVSGEVARAVEDVREECRARCAGCNGARAHVGMWDQSHDSGSWSRGLGESPGYWEAMLTEGNGVPAYGEVMDPRPNGGVHSGLGGRVGPEFQTSADVTLTDPMAVNSTLEDTQGSGQLGGQGPAGPSPP